MSNRSVLFGTIVLSLLSAGCGLQNKLENPKQPKDLGAPWVNKTESDWGSSMTSSDAAGNRVFTMSKSDFRGLVESIANEFNTAITVQPAEMLDWNLTVEVKGKKLDDALADLSAKCRLTVGKTADGLPRLTLPGKESSPESVVKPDVEAPESMDDDEK